MHSRPRIPVLIFDALLDIAEGELKLVDLPNSRVLC